MYTHTYTLHIKNTYFFIYLTKTGKGGTSPV